MSLQDLPEDVLILIIKRVARTEPAQLVVLAQTSTRLAELLFRTIGGWGKASWVCALRAKRGRHGPWLGWAQIAPGSRHHSVWHCVPDALLLRCAVVHCVDSRAERKTN